MRVDAFLSSVAEFIYTAKNTFLSVVRGIGFFDIIDIIILAFIIFKVIEFSRESRAKTLLKGIFLVVVMYALSGWLDMLGINWLLEKLINYGLVLLVIIFQPELRRALERMGHSSFGLLGKSNAAVNQSMLDCIDNVCKAVSSMSEVKTGALIVFENKTPLGEIINTGTVIDAEASVPMLCNVFFPKSPLHDGAMIIRDGRIEAAGCILPLTSNADISQDLGTRHRAAIGISENSDAITVVVSEETGIISLTSNGTIERNFNAQSLRQELYEIFAGDDKPKNEAIQQLITKGKQLINRFFKKDGENNG